LIGWCVKVYKSFHNPSYDYNYGYRRGVIVSAKTIYILGAGSSIGHSNNVFPSINQFFSKAKERGFYNNNGFYQLYKYVCKYFGEDIKTSEALVNIEDVLSNIEIDIEKNSSPELLLTKKETLNLIRKLLNELSEDVLQERIINNGEYDLLKHRIFDTNKEESKAKKNSSTIITYNWDVMFDDLLGRKSLLDKSEKNTCVDYRYNDLYHDYSAKGEGTLGGISLKAPYPNHNRNQNKGYYIKLHGSIDWFYCSNESCRVYNKVFPVLHPEEGLFCSYCHEYVNCMIVPPMINKAYRQYPIIRTLWNLAYKEISVANTIVIWGYSLPPTDYYSKWLLRQACKKYLKHLVIINKSVVKEKNRSNELNKDFINKFMYIFRDKFTKSSMKKSVELYETFADYNDKKVEP